MDRKALINTLRHRVTVELNEAYGFAAVAEMPGKIILSAGVLNETVEVTIEDKTPEPEVANG